MSPAIHNVLRLLIAIFLVLRLRGKSVIATPVGVEGPDPEGLRRNLPSQRGTGPDTGANNIDADLDNDNGNDDMFPDRAGLVLVRSDWPTGLLGGDVSKFYVINEYKGSKIVRQSVCQSERPADDAVSFLIYFLFIKQNRTRHVH